MTVAYNSDVATSGKFGNFFFLLFRWRGSIYKLVWPHVAVYLVGYFIISLLYRFYFKGNESMDGHFKFVASYCRDYGGMIPLSFILGFYVSQIVTRWWSQWQICPWPDNLAILIATHLQGEGERSRLMRRTIMRYVNLTFTLTMRIMSPQAENRFPTLDHLVDAGFLLEHEKIIIENLNNKNTYLKYWVPLIWAGGVIQRARREGRIVDDMALSIMAKNITKFRNGCGDLLGFDWVNIPLVYNQVAALAVYLYFFASLLGQQFTSDDPLDVVFPLFLFLEFFFYMGWLKVGEVMLNPWGGDDDDFEVNWMIDRNFCVSYLIVDEMHTDHPEMLKDQYWDEIVPEELPYNDNTYKYKRQTEMSMRGSTYHQHHKLEKSIFIKSSDADRVSRHLNWTDTAADTSVMRNSSQSVTKPRSRKSIYKPITVIVEGDKNRTETTETTVKSFMDSSFVQMGNSDKSYSAPTASTFPTSSVTNSKSPGSSKHPSAMKNIRSGDVPINLESKTDNAEYKNYMESNFVPLEHDGKTGLPNTTRAQDAGKAKGDTKLGSASNIQPLKGNDALPPKVGSATQNAKLEKEGDKNQKNEKDKDKKENTNYRKP